MNKKKPPPRPPLPQGSSVTSTPTKTSISIRYNPSNIEIDSDEEISIVRQSKLTSQSSAEELEKMQSSCSLQEDNHSKRLSLPEDLKSSASSPDLSGQTSSSFKKFFFSKTTSKSPVLQKATEKTNDNVEIRNRKPSSTGKTPSLTSDETTPGDDEFEHVDLCCDLVAGGGQDDRTSSDSFEKTSSPPLLKVDGLSRGNSRSSSPVFDSSPRAISPQIFRSSKMSFTALLASRHSPEPENVQENKDEASNELVNIPSFSLSPDKPSSDSSFHVVKPIPLKTTTTSISSEAPDIPYMFLWICTMFFYTYYISNVPSFINGIVVGAELMYLTGCLFLWIFSPEESLQLKFEREMQEYENRRRRLSQVDYSSRDPNLLKSSDDLKSWMYKCDDYESDDEKSSSDLTLVHVLLSGQSLIISYPSTETEQKVRTQFNIGKDYSEIKFVQEDKYSLENGSVAIHPQPMRAKKVWNRKFPLCVVAKVISSSDDWQDLCIENEENHFEKTSHPVSPTSTSSYKSEENIMFEETFFLFARAGREKEEWYNRLKQAVRGGTGLAQEYPDYMAKLIPDSKSISQTHSQVAWVNVLFGRIFWDVWQDDYWTNKLKQRIQTKLGKLKLPYFIRYLKITDLNIGQSFPAITKAYPPTLNERGTWVDLDVTYSGAFILTLETSVNVEYYRTLVTDMAKEGNVEDECGLLLEQKVEYSRVSTPEESTDSSRSVDEIEDWDSEQESESSTASNSSTLTSPVKTSSSRVFPQSAKGKKIMGMVERIAKNKWVQKAAETKFVQKAVEKFSNMPITLTVQVQRIKGTLTLNIPPPPTDRLWYGFRETPMLFVSARPKLGERQIKLTHVTDWIEKKLKQEFKGMFVLPHMEDLTIRLMNTGLEEELLQQGAK